MTGERRAYKHIERALAPHGVLTTTAAISNRMAGVRRSGTDAERRVRKAATQAGLRYRLDNRDLPGSPDLANRRRKWAIFVHGCFWHRHEGCKRATTPKSNRAFWLAKFKRNQERDRRVEMELRARGYEVIVVWECGAIELEELVRRESLS